MNDSTLQYHDSNQPQADAEATVHDLPVTEEQQDQVKGGPIYMQYEGVKGSVTTAGFEKGVQ